jgi:hypothetical protein
MLAAMVPLQAKAAGADVAADAVAESRTGVEGLLNG